MIETLPAPDPAASRIALPVAAELQDDLLIATNDLERLQRLLADTGNALLAQFTGALCQLERTEGESAVDAAALQQARVTLAGAVTALQFQDLAQQLIAHTACRLHHCADRVASLALDDDDEPAVVVQAPTRPNPVTQDEMDAGSIELF